MTDGMLLWWTLDSVPLPLKVVKEALQWRSKWQTQVQSYFNQTKLTSELNLQGDSSLLNSIFVRRTIDLEKTANMT